MIRTLLLLAVSVPAGWAADLSVERTADHRILIRRAGIAEPILVQNARPNFRPYIHPIVAPGRQGVLTEDSPKHHTWQHGLCVGLNKVNGHDFWTRDNGFHPKPLASPIAQGNTAAWRVEARWTGAGQDAAPVLMETQRWKLTDLGDCYLLDLDGKQSWPAHRDAKP